MKLALISMVSFMALSVKSMNYVTSISIVGGALDTASLLPYFQFKNMPILDVQSTDMLCRTSDMTAAVTPYVIAAGATIRINWDIKAQSPYSGIDPVGPCVFWLAPYESNGVGKVWSKIHEYKYKGNDERADWCSVKIVQNGGYYDIDFPSGIAKGKYCHI